MHLNQSLHDNRQSDQINKGLTSMRCFVLVVSSGYRLGCRPCLCPFNSSETIHHVSFVDLHGLLSISSAPWAGWVVGCRKCTIWISTWFSFLTFLKIHAIWLFSSFTNGLWTMGSFVNWYKWRIYTSSPFEKVHLPPTASIPPNTIISNVLLLQSHFLDLMPWMICQIFF